MNDSEVRDSRGERSSAASLAIRNRWDSPAIETRSGLVSRKLRPRSGLSLELEKKKPVILTGDLNCAHQEIDIYNPAGNKRSAGFTDEERQSFGKNFLSQGFVDTFRAQHPGVVGYTYWGYRHGARKTNKGWRLDYFLVSESIADQVHDSYILPDIGGSDHCPIGLVLKH
ncbi:hypothetical protein Pint_17781 [Pistacia integerrima]|uniref:Uncharacterized protein n=1 Tax=Pistacia integerrima TaxID=434235 RepID=A0ACC0YW92_9ROSI|nr:hypothetical protein Pint_17781 [Pistacia integerrima]